MSYRSQLVSAVLITRDNSATIERALESLKWVDEIVVVDCGSADGTVSIARRFTENIYFHPSGSKTALVNYALSLASGDWTLYIEPDEWVEEMLRHEIDGLLLNPGDEMDGYMVPRKFYFQGEWLQKGGLYPDRDMRFFRSARAQALYQPGGCKIVVPGPVASIDRAIAREPYTTVEALFAGFNRHGIDAAYAALEKDGFGKGGKAKDNDVSNLILHPPMAFLQKFFLSMGFTEGFGGLAVAMAHASRCFFKYATRRHLISGL